MSTGEAAAWLVLEKDTVRGAVLDPFKDKLSREGQSWAPWGRPAQVGSDAAGCPALAQGPCPLLRPGPCSPTTICGTTWCSGLETKDEQDTVPTLGTSRPSSVGGSSLGAWEPEGCRGQEKTMP